MAITIESVSQKLGFDPLNPPEYTPKDPFEIDDNMPSIWAPLSPEEMAFVIEIRTGKKIQEFFPE